MVGHRRAPLGRGAGAARPRRRDRARRRQRDPQPARVPRGGRPRLPDAGPCRADAVGRRGPAHPSRGAARQQPAGRLLRARRADDRPAPARQPGPARRAEEPQRQGQHAGRRRARRGHDPRRRPHHRHRPGRRQARRAPRRAGHVDAARGAGRLGDRPLPRAAAGPSARPAAPGAAGFRHGHVAIARHRGRRAGRLARDRRRLAAQPARPRRARALAPPDRGDRRQRLRQVDAGARRAADQRPGRRRDARDQGGPRRAGARRASGVGRLRHARRLRDDRPRARGRPDADRQDAALVSGDLHRLLGHDPQALRRDARGPGARLRAGALQLQHRRRAAARPAKGRGCRRSR